jgi:hypothetical protein
MCITTAVLIAGSVASTGGLAAVVMKKSRVKNAGDNHSTPNLSKEVTMAKGNQTNAAIRSPNFHHVGRINP